MPKGRRVFISYSHDIILDDAARALSSPQDPDLETEPTASISGQIFTVYFRGDDPEVQALTPPPPPRHAERLLNYVLPRARREEILGDLEEDYYTKWVPKYGFQEARRLYWSDAIRSIAPMLWSGVKGSGIIAAILGVAEWLRDRLG
jgi:hypothetical protein